MVRQTPANVMAQISEDQLRAIHDLHGPGGLFRLFYLMMSHGQEFEHFFDIDRWELVLHQAVGLVDSELEFDNDRLRAADELSNFNYNVLIPSLARKLYNPGRHPGYLAYGLGGPRILVSHPFQGINGDIYDVYNNSVDVVTSLVLRGFHGRFLFLDYLGGLNFKIRGTPAWLAWFSLIAAHSDMVIFIKEHAEGFSAAQQLEIGLTPDRVKKKIVEIPHTELKWAKTAEYDPTAKRMYIGEHGEVTQEEFERMEAQHALPLVTQYAEGGFPRDRLILIGEDGGIHDYATDHPVYVFNH